MSCDAANNACPAHSSCNLALLQCVCDSGFQWSGGACADVNECATNNGGCDAHATCTNTPGSRTCSCSTGYSGNGLTCSDVNECSLGTDNCDAQFGLCTNTPGSFTCRCMTGTTGNGVTCTDVNECLTANGGCSVNATCTNTPGSRTCACNTGYRGDGAYCGHWVQRSNGPTLYGAGIAYDTFRHRAVLFGGWSGSAALNTTWEWNGSTWSQINVTGPGARYEPLMTYDAARHVVVLYGGYNNGPFSDTWEYDGTSWAQRQVTGPGQRNAGGLAWDAVRHVSVLYGGAFDSSVWEWGGVAWVQKSPSGAPASRFYFGMTWDDTIQEVVVVGGTTGPDLYSTTYVKGTWSWNGTSWTTVTGLPNELGNAGVSYHGALGITMLVGGQKGAAFAGDVLTLDTSASTPAWATWSFSSTPSARAGAATVYDSDRDQLLLVSGSTGSGLTNQTWVFTE